MNNLDKYSSYSFFCQATGSNGIHTFSKNAENSLDRVKIKKPEILVYKEVHEFPVFAIFALDKLVICA